MMWKRIFVTIGFAAAFAVTSPSLAEGCYSCGDAYGGAYNTGGYNLLDFSLNLYDTSNYLYNNYGYDNYGGGCGSFYGSCSSPYSTSGLYGGDWGATPYLYGYGGYGSGGYSGLGYDSGLDLTININILGGLGGGLYGSYPYGGYGSSIYGGYDPGCSIGYCSSYGGMPYSGGGGGGYYNNLWGYNNYGLPGYNNVDVNVYNPFQNYTPPSYTPPYGGCGGYIPCPTGPVTRTDPPNYWTNYPPTTYPTYPPTYYPPRVDPPTHTPPTYTPPGGYYPPTGPGYQDPSSTNQIVPTPPNRYRIPRG